MSVELGQRVRALRERLGLSQDELARRGRVGRVEITKIEGGKHNLSTHRIRQALADGLNLTTDELGAYLDGSLSVEVAEKRAKGARGKTLAAILPSPPYDRFPNLTLALDFYAKEGREWPPAAIFHAREGIWQDDVQPSEWAKRLDWLKDRIALMHAAAKAELGPQKPRPRAR